LNLLGAAGIGDGFSGNPLSMVPFRPVQSPQSWMYVADSVKMVKVNVAARAALMGIAPPPNAPDLRLGGLTVKTIEDFDRGLVITAATNANPVELTLTSHGLTNGETITISGATGAWAPINGTFTATVTGVNTFTIAVDSTAFGALTGTPIIVRWTAGGTAAGIVATARELRVNTTIAAIVYDIGTTGWATVQPTSAVNIQDGIYLVVSGGGGENVLVQSVTRPPVIAAVATISSIIYDSTGTLAGTGLCSIVPTIATEDIIQDGLITIAGEVVRIISVSVSPDGVKAFRCSTTVNRAAGNAITGLASFRAFFSNAGAHAPADTLVTNDYYTSCGGAGTLFLTNPPVGALIGTYDLTHTNFPPAAASRQIQSDDEVHLSILVSNLAAIVEGRVMFDVDRASGGNVAATAFTTNYYFYAFSPSKLVPIAKGTLTVPTTRQGAITTDLINQVDIVPEFGTSNVYDRSAASGSSPGAFEDGEPAEPIAGQTGTGDAQWMELRFKVSDLVRVGTDQSLTMASVGSIRIQITATAAITTFKADALWIGGSFGPDMGDIGSPYYYRYRARSAVGARSLPSPPTRNAAGVRRQSVSVIMEAVTDPQVDSTVGGVLEVERFGGANVGVDSEGNPIWRYVGEIPNTAGGMTFLDVLPDEIVANAPIGREDTFQPFPVVDRPKSGTVNVTGTTVIWASGDQFNTGWAPGTEIIINGTPYTIYSQPKAIAPVVAPNAKFLEIIQNAGTQTGVTYRVNEPTLLGTPLPFLWGPMAVTGEMFSCGDFRNPGKVYWTNPNDPDTTDEINNAELCGPSESLQTGGIFQDTRPFVLSTERLWVGYPQQNVATGGRSWVWLKVEDSKGLAARWGLAIGPLVYFIGRDGIYETDLNAVRSITDEDLYPLFPHGDVDGADTNGYTAPDFGQPDEMRLSFDQGFLRFSYLDRNNARQQMFYRVADKAWWPANYPTHNPKMFYEEEGQNLASCLVGSTNGSIYQVGGASDAGVAIAGEFQLPCLDMGDMRGTSLFGDYVIDMDPATIQTSVTAGFDNNTALLAVTTVPSAAGLSGRAQYVVDINSGSGGEARNMSIKVAWTSILRPFFYGWIPSFVPKPEATNLRATDWDDAGYAGAKWLQGCVIEADTDGVNRTINVQGDNGVVIASITVNHSIQVEIPYSWPGAYTHAMRMVPTTSGSWKVFKVRWVFEPAPEFTDTWECPDMTLWNGFGHMHSFYIPLLSVVPVTLLVTIDGVAQAAYTIPAGTGLREIKNYVTAVANKGKVVRFKLTGMHRLMKQDVEIHCRGWGENGPYRIVKPFGDISVESGARI
jgi:hypothetical protein